jgi:hypothetical protein
LFPWPPSSTRSGSLEQDCKLARVMLEGPDLAQVECLAAHIADTIRCGMED